MKERFLADLKKINEIKTEPEKKDALLKIVKRLDDPNVLSGNLFLPNGVSQLNSPIFRRHYFEHSVKFPRHTRL